MNKFLALAALFGYAATKSVAKYEESSPLIEGEWFNANMDVLLDFGWGTHYINSPPNEMYNTHMETYGVNVYSKVIYRFSGEAFKFR